mmetsp:Transcript_8303/g.17217  ORF Transcript_8303/g.17217 Transcript_8303/m.17217 type:complete len:200 (-) Transcript_8303:1226-1825(-)
MIHTVGSGDMAFLSSRFRNDHPLLAIFMIHISSSTTTSSSTGSTLGSGCRSSAIVGNRPLGSHAFLYGACKILLQICSMILKVAIRRAFGTSSASAGGASTRSSASGGALFLHALFAFVFLSGDTLLAFVFLLADTLLALILSLGSILLAFVRNVGTSTALWLLLGRACRFGLNSTPISRNLVFLVQTDAFSWYLICYR